MKTQILPGQFFLIAFQFLFVSASFAQTLPVKEWDKSFGGERNEEMYIIIQTNDGGYLIGGDSDSPMSGDVSQNINGLSDYWIVKTDALGNKMWDKRFGGNSKDELFSILQTPDNGYLLGGTSLSVIGGDQTQSSRGGRDYWLVKTDVDGNKLWDKRFGGPADDVLRAVSATNDGGFILAGQSLSGIGSEKTEVNHGKNDVWIVKTDQGGNLVWEASYGGTDDDQLNAIQQTAGGDYILGAWTLSPASFDVTQPGKGKTDMWLVKVNGNGVKIWDIRYGGDDNEYLYALDQTGDGGFILAGYTRSNVGGDVTVPGQGGFDFWLVKTNGDGVMEWDKRYGGLLDEKLKSLFETSDGGFIMGGWSDSGISGDKSQDTKGFTDYWLLRTDENGNKLWDLDFGANGEERLHHVLQSSDGGFMVGGHSMSGKTGDKSQVSNGLNDYWVIKLSATTAGQLFYADDDSDGFGNAAIDTLAIIAPSGYVSDNTDCNDQNSTVNPDEIDICNVIDDNCNGQTDENAIVASITPAGIAEVCKGTEVTFVANTGSSLSYQWLKNGANISNATSMTYSTSNKGDYQVKESNSFNCNSTSAVTTLKTLSIPDAIITPQGDLDICVTGSVVLEANGGNNIAYQWQKNGSKILGATNKTYTATVAAIYKVVVKKNNGCSQKSAGTGVTKSCKLTSNDETSFAGSLMAYPNPASDKFIIELNMDETGSLPANIEVSNIIGQLVYAEKATVENGLLRKEISTSHSLPNGMYLVKVTVNNDINPLNKFQWTRQIMYQR